MFFNVASVPPIAVIHVNESKSVDHDVEFQGVGKGPLYILVILVLVAENLLVIGAAHMRKRKSIPDVFMLTLALSAILNAFVVVGIMTHVILVMRVPLSTSWYLCATQYFFLFSLRQFDISIITLISLDRYVAVCKPFLYRTRCKVRHGIMAVAVALLVATLLAMTPFMNIGRISLHLKTICMLDWASPSAIIIIIYTYVQFIIVLFCYICVFKSILNLVHRQQEIERSQNPTYKRVSETLKRFTIGRGSKKKPKKKIPSPRSSISSTWTVESFDYPSSIHTPQRNSCSSNNSNTLGCKMYDGQCKNEEMLVREVSPSATPLRRISEEQDLDDVSSVTSCESDDKVDCRANSADYLGSRQSWVLQDNSRKLSGMGLINVGAEEDEVFRVDTAPKDVVAITRIRSEGDKDNAKKSAAESRIGPPGLVERSISLPDILDDKETKETSFGKAGRYRAKRTSAPSLRPSLTKQLSSLRDRWKRVIVKRSSSQMKRSWRESRHFAGILGIVVVIYYVTYLPLAIQITLWMILGPTDFLHSLGFYARNMTLLSPLLIPIVYGLMCKPYRKNYKRIIYRIFCVKFLRKACMKQESLEVTEDSADNSRF